MAADRTQRPATGAVTHLLDGDDLALLLNLLSFLLCHGLLLLGLGCAGGDLSQQRLARFCLLSDGHLLHRQLGIELFQLCTCLR